MHKDITRFSFGDNWSDYLEHSLDSERLAIAKSQTLTLLDLDSLEGLNFLDIGCGSGLFSLVAHDAGARQIISVDLDPASIDCCRRLQERAGNPSNWTVLQGSILDHEFVDRLPPADVVYCWGVLHHTGDMWNAMRNVAGKVNCGGRLAIAIYNRLEYDTLHRFRGSPGWHYIKRRYNRSGWLGKRALECALASKDVLSSLVRLRNPVREARRYSAKRGMSWWYDIVDWIGGYPYEYASAGEVFSFCHEQLGLELLRMNTTSSIGCHEFVFQRSDTPA